MRFALIGYGAWGRLHAQVLQRLAETRLVAIACGGEASAAAAGADHPEAKVVGDWRALLDDPAIDAIDVVAPNHLHAEMALAALAAGKHVLLEKPMATTIADCDRLVAAARGPAVLSVGHELRVSHQWAAIKRALDEGRIGRPRYLNLSLFRHPFRPGAGGWRRRREGVGSWTLEELVHFFDLVLWYGEALGPPRRLRARGHEAADRPGLFANLTVELDFAGGAYALVTQTLDGFEHHLVLEIAGEGGALRSWWSGGSARTRTPRFELKIGPSGLDPVEPAALASSGEVFELEEQIRRTAGAFAEGRPLVSAVEARRAVVVCLEAERAAREGVEIELAL